jgi:putative transposase
MPSDAPARRPYPSDLSDAEWSLLEPLFARRSRLGRPQKWPRRLLADAVFYLLRSGCAWRMLPRDLPPWATVYSQFRRWRLDGTIRSAHDRLRGRVRAAEGRDPEPSAAVIDSQTVRCSAAGGPARGYDGGKRANGRKRHLLVDASGLVLLAHVHAADVHDRLGAQALISRAEPSELPRLELVRGDGAYDGPFARWPRAERGWRVEVPRHRDRQLWRYGLQERPRGFQVIPRRWVVERTFAWLGQARRLARDFERLPETGEAMIHAVMARLMLRRLSASETHAQSGR